MRVAKTIELDELTERELRVLSKRRTVEARLQQRAMVVLLAAEGRQNKDIAVEAGLDRRQVALWRERFLAGGVDALRKDVPRSARPATITAEIESRIRGLLSEFGIVLPLKTATVRREAALVLEDLPGRANLVIGDLLSEVHRLDERVEQYDRQIVLMAREDERARHLMRLSGVGETTATALIAMIGNPGALARGCAVQARPRAGLDCGRPT